MFLRTFHGHIGLCAVETKGLMPDPWSRPDELSVVVLVQSRLNTVNDVLSGHVPKHNHLS